MQKEVLVIGSILILTGIILGAFGAHYIEQVATSSDTIEAFKTAVRYQMYHGLVMFVLSFHQEKLPLNLKAWNRWLFTGLLLFILSIYAIVGIDIYNSADPGLILALMTPLGGSVLVLTWSVWVFKIIKNLHSNYNKS